MENFCTPKDIHDLLSSREVATTLEPFINGYTWDGTMCDAPIDFNVKKNGGKFKATEEHLKYFNHFTLLLKKLANGDEKTLDLTITPFRFYINDFEFGNRDFSKLWRMLLKRRHAIQYYRCRIIFHKSRLHDLESKLAHIDPKNLRLIAEINAEISNLQAQITRLENIARDLESKELSHSGYELDR